MSRTDLVQRPSYHLEQRFHRRWPEAAAQVTQGFLRRAGHRHVVQAGSQLAHTARRRTSPA
jgi:hypothetical protein